MNNIYKAILGLKQYKMSNFKKPLDLIILLALYITSLKEVNQDIKKFTMIDFQSSIDTFCESLGLEVISSDDLMTLWSCERNQVNQILMKYYA